MPEDAGPERAEIGHLRAQGGAPDVSQGGQFFGAQNWGVIARAQCWTHGRWWAGCLGQLTGQCHELLKRHVEAVLEINGLHDGPLAAGKS